MRVHALGGEVLLLLLLVAVFFVVLSLLFFPHCWFLLLVLVVVLRSFCHASHLSHSSFLACLPWISLLPPQVCHFQSASARSPPHLRRSPLFISRALSLRSRLFALPRLLAETRASGERQNQRPGASHRRGLSLCIAECIACSARSAPRGNAEVACGAGAVERSGRAATDAVVGKAKGGAEKGGKWEKIEENKKAKTRPKQSRRGVGKARKQRSNSR